jgi:hypothetical protein
MSKSDDGAGDDEADSATDGSKTRPLPAFSEEELLELFGLRPEETENDPELWRERFRILVEEFNLTPDHPDVIRGDSVCYRIAGDLDVPLAE